ncbi:MAG: hypothetical protein LBI68_08805 [Azoarcus sp.]|jgi:sulfonate transport system permease protein|nr:hypothetical protein [Azoarcus sp.]
MPASIARPALPGFLEHRALKWISPLLVLLAWSAICRAGVFPEQILVSPGVVLETCGELWAGGELPEHLGKSLYRLA